MERFKEKKKQDSFTPVYYLKIRNPDLCLYAFGLFLHIYTLILKQFHLDRSNNF